MGKLNLYSAMDRQSALSVARSLSATNPSTARAVALRLGWSIQKTSRYLGVAAQLGLCTGSGSRPANWLARQRRGAA